MKKALLYLCVTAVLVTVTAYVLFSSNNASDNKNVITLSCTIGDELRIGKRSSVDIADASLWIDERIKADTTLPKQPEILEKITCDSHNAPTVRMTALDIWFEIMAINQVLKTPEHPAQDWNNAITGTLGTVTLRNVGMDSGRRCAIVEFPSKIPILEGDGYVSAVERFCYSELKKGWVNDGVISYEAGFVPDQTYRPGIKT